MVNCFLFFFSGGSTGEDRKGKAKEQEKDAYVTQYQIVSFMAVNAGVSKCC